MRSQKGARRDLAGGGQIAADHRRCARISSLFWGMSRVGELLDKVYALEHYVPVGETYEYGLASNVVLN